MIYPTHFYYSEQSSEIQYDTSGQGVFTVSQLINGQPYWKKYGSSSGKKQKTLILADWTAAHWSTQHTDSIINKLNQLIKNGFVICIWHNGSVEQLSNPFSLKESLIRSKMVLAYDQQIYQAANLFNPKLNPSNSFILNDYELAGLDTPQIVDRKRVLNIEHMPPSGYNFLSQIDILKKVTPPFSKILQSNYSMEACQKLEYIKKYFPSLPIEYNYHQAVFTEPLLALTSNLAQSNFWPMLANVEKFVIPGPHSLTSLAYGLSKFETTCQNLGKIKHLEVGNVKLHRIVNETFNLPLLERLKLQVFLPTTSGLQRLIAKSPMLSQLEVYFSRKASWLSEGAILNIPNLKVLMLGHLTISSPLTLQNLLASTKIEKIVFNSCRLEGLKIEELSLLYLQSCIITNTYISPEGLRKIITAPKIKKLKLINTLNELDTTDLPSLTIEYLTLESKLLSGKLISRLLAKMPNLKSLTLVGDLSNLDVSEISTLPLLVDLCLNKVKIKVEQLQQLLMKTKKLVNLLIVSSSSLDLTGVNLSSLQLFNAVGSCSSNNLSFLITNAFQLRTLELFAGKIPDLIIKEGTYLPSLNSIDFSQSKVSIMTLYGLLAVSRVKRLILTQCTQLADFTGLSTFLLPDLEELYLMLSDITMLGLRKLLSAAPALKILNLSGCTHIFFFSVQNIDFPSLVHMHFGRFIITEKELLCFLNQAPKLRGITIENLTNLDVWSVDTYKKLLNYELSDELRTILKGKIAGVPDRDPVPNAENWREHTTPKKNFVFEYKGQNNHRNQKMIIEKLSQYMTIRQQNTAQIYKFQPGICIALSHFYSRNFQSWNGFITGLLKWNGHYESLTVNLQKGLDSLLAYAKKYHLENFYNARTYLGEHLEDVLETNSMTSMILSNPWHWTTLHYSASDNAWFYYDPLYIDGPKIIRSFKELAGFIKASLGDLVFIDGQFEVNPLISDPLSFIKNGGLLALARANNGDVMLPQMLLVKDYSNDSLQGLLLRDIVGAPTWCYGLLNPLTLTFTLKLLMQFQQKDPDYLPKLQKSLNDLTAMQRQDCLFSLTQIIVDKPASASVLSVLRLGLRDILETDYSTQLETWSVETTNATSVNNYCQNLVNQKDAKKRVVNVVSDDSANALTLELIAYCKSIGRPIYFITSPDELACSASWIESTAKNNSGILRKGPGGRLHDFLLSTKGKAPVLVVNYTQFKSDEYLHSNSLYDKKRMVDGTAIPEDALVLAIVNIKNPNAYLGSDFYSRFDTIEQCLLDDKELNKLLAKEPDLLEPHRVNADYFPIHLAHNVDWEERLLGRWLIKKDRLVFEEGLLQKALSSQKPLCIHNGLWDKPGFQWRWQQLKKQGQIPHQGQTINIPQDQQFYRSEGYAWQSLSAQLIFNKELTRDLNATVMNPQRLTLLYYHYVHDKETSTLDTLPGLIQAHEGKVFPIYLTRSLTEDEWGELLVMCEMHQVRLQCQCAAGVVIPKDLAHFFPDINNTPLAIAPAWSCKDFDNPLVITSTDMAVTIASITQDEDWLSIDISECDISDLLHSIDGTIDKESLQFSFQQRIAAVSKALAENKKVLLHGVFSNELMDGLAPLLLNPINQGRLVLVGDNAKVFNYCSIKHHQVTSEEQKQLLIRLYQASDDECHELIKMHNQFNKMRASLIHQRAFPETTNSPWQGMEAAGNILSDLAFNAAQSKEIAEAFTKKRVDEVNALFSHAPYVCLTGPSGSGKSAFVEQVWALQPGVTLYKGESRMLEWAQDNGPGEKYLFIDEANSSKRQWSEFEGLFKQPPGVLIDGVYYPISAQHKVIFALNPKSYGGERQSIPLLEHHGNAIAFEPLPAEFIYEYLLKPVFANTSLATDEALIVGPLMKVYGFIMQQTKDEVLISPREVQMMALEVLSYVQRYPQTTTAERVLAAQHYAYRLGLNLNTLEMRAEFNELFKPQDPLPYESLPKKYADFLITESRQSVAQQLDDLLLLTDFRRSKAKNNAQKYGGLGGLVLESIPGVGKSELVTASLDAHGYKERHEDEKVNEVGRFYYRLPVMMHVDDKRRLLLKAFNEGAVVVIDEINSSALMERLLNDLLMGKTPEGKPPAHPGFLVIGTQNPPTMGARTQASNAMSRRLITMVLSAYPQQEMIAILVDRGLEQSKAEKMVQAFQSNYEKAVAQRLNPLPTFRDLLRLADKVIPQKPSAAIIRFQEAITALNTYGQKLIDEEQAEAEGQETIQLASSLKTIADLYFHQQVTEKEKALYAKRFKQLFEQGYRDMSTHRALWKPIVANILINIALIASGIGLIYMINKVWGNSPMFFNETNRQQKVMEISTAFESVENIKCSPH